MAVEGQRAEWSLALFLLWASLWGMVASWTLVEAATALPRWATLVGQFAAGTTTITMLAAVALVALLVADQVA